MFVKDCWQDLHKVKLHVCVTGQAGRVSWSWLKLHVGATMEFSGAKGKACLLHTMSTLLLAPAGKDPWDFQDDARRFVAAHRCDLQGLGCAK